MLINSQYQILQTNAIGRGSFSRVYLGHNVQTSEKVAIKKIDVGTLPRAHINRLEGEIAILRVLDHPNLVKTYDIVSREDDGYVYIIMEYCGGGDFAKFLTGNRLKENKVRYYMYQLMLALYYLRDRNIFHRDLKPANLLLTEDNRILKVADFGFARSLPDNVIAETLCGTPLYMAPEILFDKRYTTKSDLWSIGMIMYQAVYGRLLYADVTNEIDLMRFIQEVPISFPKNVHVSVECLDLLHGLLQKDPSLRISWPEFFHHPWFEPFALDFYPLRLQSLQASRSTPTLEDPKITSSYNQSHPIPIKHPDLSMSYSPKLIDDYIPSFSPTFVHSDQITGTVRHVKAELDHSSREKPPIEPIKQESTLSILWNVITSSLRLFSNNNLH